MKRRSESDKGGGAMEAYKRWVRKNRDFVHSLESLANGITWLLPERFSNSEIGPEAVYSFLGVVGAINQHILDTAPSRSRPHFTGRASFPWSLCVSTLKDLETVVEVAAQHFYGVDGKWSFIAVAEAVKAAVRLALFRDSGYRMLLQGGEVVNVERKQPKAMEGLHGAAVGNPNGNPGQVRGYNGFVPQNLEERAMSVLSRFGEEVKMASDPFWNQIQKKSQMDAMSMEKSTLATIWCQRGLSGRLFLTGEVLHIMRPLIYVLMIRRYGIRSWKPWLISLAMDLTGMGILSYATNPSSNGEKKIYEMSAGEKDEIKRRKVIWALYIMRDPFFTHYTKERLEKTDTSVRNVPVIGFLTGKLVELAIGAQTRYTYTSGS